MTTSGTAEQKVKSKRKKRRSRTPLLSPSDAQRALYVDYEGSKDRPPTVLGMLVDDVPCAAIVEPLFAACRRRHRARHVDAADHRTLVAELVDRAEREDRVIVSWSKHDCREMQLALEGDSERLSTLERRYRDARLTARRWKNVTYPDAEGPNSLDLYRALLLLDVPERFGRGVVGKAIAMLRQQLQQGRGFAELSDGAKEGWRSIVAHNRYDLLNMRAVCVTTADALAERERERREAGDRRTRRSR